MQKVAKLDLRTNDAWDVDFVLVKHSLVHSKSMESIIYFDRCGDPIYFSGDDYEADNYYRNYCMRKGLLYVTYEDMERQDLDELLRNIKR